MGEAEEVPESLAPEVEERRQLSLVPRIPDRMTDGKDEMNFAEFPLSSISERVDPSVKTLVFEDKILDKSRNAEITRQVMVTGSDAHGLPTATDEHVLLALIQLSKLQGFKNKRVAFTRYQLLQLLGWSHTGQNYQRLLQALNRWMGVTLFYKNAWRDREGKRWLNNSFHVLDRVSIRGKKTGDGGAEGDEPSYFEWNDVVFKSFKAGNIKALDYDFFLSLEGTITKRLYRFLDKRFWHCESVEFKLKHLAYEHIGIARSSPTGDLKRKINAAVDELEKKGYLEPTPREKRFVKEGPGAWKVLFRKRDDAAQGAEDAAPPSLEENLVRFGVHARKARELAATCAKELIKEKIAIATWMKERGDSRIACNPAGYLVCSIEQAYAPPQDFKSEQDQAKRKKVGEVAAKAKLAKDELMRQQAEAREAAKRKAVDHFLCSVSPEERSRIEAEALASAEPGRQKLMRIGGKVGEAAKQIILDQYVLKNILSVG